MTTISENLPVFSIILPVYNGESIISSCIESILAQEYSAYELIIIDDGSTDKTQIVCQKYCGVETKVKYHKQENGGVSSARNKGINIAKYEYVLFIDADDYWSISFLRSFAELITSRNLDNKTLVIQDFVAEIQFEQGRRESYKWCKFSSRQYTLPEMFRELSVMNWLNWGVPFAKLYCLSIIKQYSISFNEQMSFREDLIFMLDYINYVDSIIFDSTANYHYTIDNTKLSLSNTTASFDNEMIFFDYIKKMTNNYVNKFQLGKEEYLVLHGVLYASFFRCLNSCIYKYKIPMSRQERISKLRFLSTKENIQGLSQSGIINTKIKHFAFFLLKNKLYSLYDLLNKFRYGLS